MTEEEIKALAKKNADYVAEQVAKAKAELKEDIDAKNETIEALKKANDELLESNKAIETRAEEIEQKLATIKKDSPTAKPFSVNFIYTKDDNAPGNDAYAAKTEFTADAALAYSASRYGPATQKAYDAVHDITGGATSSITAWYADYPNNPLEMLATRMEVGDVNGFNIPNIGNITVSKNGNVAPNRYYGDGTAGNAPAATTLASQAVVVDHYQTLARNSTVAVNRIQGLDSVTSMAMLDAMEKEEGVTGIETFEAENAITNSIETGVAHTAGGDFAGIPTDFKKYTGMQAGLKQRYWKNAVWLMSPKLFVNIWNLVAGGNDIMFSPERNIIYLLGKPIFIMEQIADGSAADDAICYFGDFKKACIYGYNNRMEMSRNTYTNPGSLTYYCDKQSGFGMMNKDAVIKMVVPPAAA